MELDEIKILLKQKLEENIPLQSAGDLEAFARKRTGSVISRIKRNIWLEFTAFLFCMAIAVWIWVSYASVVVYFFCAATWIFSIVFCAYLFMLYKRIIFYETVPGNIKEKLQQIILIVTRFTRLYFRISMGLLPVIFVFGLITGYLDVSKQGLLQQFHWSRGILFYILFFISWSALLYFFAKWYIKKLYGDYLAQLQQQLKDIENG